MRILFWVMVALAASPSGRADEPFRLHEAVEAPGWLTLKGESRARYETLDGQFRAGREGSDQLLLMRALLLAEADTGPVSFGAELQDSRTYLGDDGTPLSGSFTNPLDFLQLYVRFDDLPGLFGETWKSELTIGRQTIGFGSERQIERVDFANVIRSFTGLHFVSEGQRGDEFHIVYVVPTAIFPSTRPELDDNRLSGDKEQWGRQIWAAHYIRPDIAPWFVPDLSGELFVYGLEERDSDKFQTPDRSYIAPGLRLYREPAAGRWDMDVEASWRTGTRRATSAAADAQDLDVAATILFAAAGVTLDMPWTPRLAVEFYHSSGDDNPADGRFDQHERLFGSRRTDLNNTSIHGPLTPANLNAPGFRIEVKPNSRLDARVYYHAAYLDAPTDSWVVAGLRDPTGQSGRFIGHTLDGRVRYWIRPDSLRLELGASGLLFGEFAEKVPGGPEGDGTLFGYAQLTFSF